MNYPLPPTLEEDNSDFIRDLTTMRSSNESCLYPDWNLNKVDRFKIVLDKEIRRVSDRITKIDMYTGTNKQTGQQKLFIDVFSVAKKKECTCEIEIDYILSPTVDPKLPFKVAEVIKSKMTIKQGRPFSKIERRS